MSNKDPFTHVRVEFKCSHCKGSGRVPGGTRQFGELVKCGLCNGSGRVGGSVSFDDFVTAVKAAMERKNEQHPAGQREADHHR